MQGSAGEVSTLAIALGGLALIISYRVLRIVSGVFVGMVLFTLLLNASVVKPCMFAIHGTGISKLVALPSACSLGLTQYLLFHQSR